MQALAIDRHQNLYPTSCLLLMSCLHTKLFILGFYKPEKPDCLFQVLGLSEFGFFFLEYFFKCYEEHTHDKLWIPICNRTDGISLEFFRLTQLGCQRREFDK